MSACRLTFLGTPRYTSQMHTVSLFPNLLDYQFLGIFIVRATIGLIFLHLAYRRIFYERRDSVEFFEKLKMNPPKVFFWVVVVIELVAGVGLTIGLYTQLIAAVAGIFMMFAALIKRHRPAVLPRNTVDFYVILSVVSFALLFLGPGVFAIDLPL